MGAYAPTPLVNDDIYKKLEDRVIKPTLKGMQEENALLKVFYLLELWL